ncbi:hypothetical protein [Sulfurospirillum deleyianum]|uniref:Uncharacterized protein n=1 Tax=Sulfurospirillum deleyianum (strain ATCC 51133 / DSM 6946 / 5175) TaxID=525898 RepID=D1B4Y7_SULD5|nr:hypothetical protein [Sulfurospirillum deleyianum]ACZ13157.1 hypothetical protein Sdel_2145 [Sulfurospirillum deleyianum DSM 6946]
MEFNITHILGFAGCVLAYFITLYYIGLNHWVVMEHNKIYAEFDAIKRELNTLKQKA